MKRRLAIRAAKLGAQPTLNLGLWAKIPRRWNLAGPGFFIPHRELVFGKI